MTEFHSYPNKERQVTCFYIKNARWFESAEVAWKDLPINRQTAHKIIMKELYRMCDAWKAKTGEDYYPIPAGIDYHEYDLCEHKIPTTQRTIWRFDR